MYDQVTPCCIQKGLTGSVAFMITPVSTESRVKKWDQVNYSNNISYLYTKCYDLYSLGCI